MILKSDNPDNSILTSKLLNSENTLYVIQGDYTVESLVLLPHGSELRVEYGSISLSDSYNKDQPDQPDQLYGIFMLLPGQDEIDDRPYYTLCLTSRAVNPTKNESEGKITLSYTQTHTVFMKDGDFIRNINEVYFEMRLTADCRILLPESPKFGAENLFI